MSERTESEDNVVVEEGGKVTDWSPINTENRKIGSQVERVFKKVLQEILERLETLDVDREQ